MERDTLAAERARSAAWRAKTMHNTIMAEQQHSLVVELAGQVDHARAWCGYWQRTACRLPTAHLRGRLVGVASDGWDGYVASFGAPPDSGGAHALAARSIPEGPDAPTQEAVMEETMLLFAEEEG